MKYYVGCGLTVAAIVLIQIGQPVWAAVVAVTAVITLWSYARKYL